MKKIILTILLALNVVVGFTKSLDNLFKSVIKEGRRIGEYYDLRTQKNELFNLSDFVNFCIKNNYIYDSEKTTYRIAKRFGDEVSVIEHFYFLPSNEIGDYTFELFTEKQASASSLKSVGKAYLFFGLTNEFKLCDNIKWQGSLSSDGLLDGYGYAFYVSNNDNQDYYIIDGRFVNGFPQGIYNIQHIKNNDDSQKFSTNIGDVKEGFASFTDEKGNYGFIGIPSSVIPSKYSKVLSGFSNGKACVQEGEQEIYINTYGEVLPNQDSFAAKWYDKAIAGDIQAQYELALCYYFGIGVKCDNATAMRWAKKSSAQGFALSSELVGRMYLFGNDVNKDEAEGNKWFRRAYEQAKLLADNGDSCAQYALYILYNNGRGIEKDLQVALKWLHRAAENGYYNAQDQLGWHYYTGTGLYQNYTETLKWSRLAAEQGNRSAQDRVGECYYFGHGVKENKEEAVKWYRKSAEQGYSSSQYSLGYCYKKGKGMAKNTSLALVWLFKAAEQHDESALMELARCYRDGEGVNKDLEKAKDYYIEAKAAGASSALTECADMYSDIEDYENEWIMLSIAKEEGEDVSQERIDNLNTIITLEAEIRTLESKISSLESIRTQQKDYYDMKQLLKDIEVTYSNYAGVWYCPNSIIIYKFNNGNAYWKTKGSPIWGYLATEYISHNKIKVSDGSRWVVLEVSGNTIKKGSYVYYRQ